VSDGTSLVPSDVFATIASGQLATTLVPGPVDYRVLTPDGPDAAMQDCPLMLCLHGGLGGHDLLEQVAPVIEEMWRSGALPQMIVATPETGHSFYLDYRDGSQLWESFLMRELLPHLRARYPVSRQRGRTLVGGVSMGGMGALRLGLKYPDSFGAVAAWEPAIEPALAWPEVRLEDRFWRSAELMEIRFGRPFDEEYWAANNPATIVATRAAALRDADLRIYLEVGSDDVYGLDRGAEFMHRTLFDHDIKHEFRMVYGADHIGPTIAPRIRDGLAFIARILKPQKTDWRVTRLRELVVVQKRRAGVAV
jgi:S-formylglutathione hydrolase